MNQDNLQSDNSTNSAWLAGPSHVSLENNQVHVWRCSLEKSPHHIKLLEATLSDDEIKRARRFYFERDRSRFAVARGVLRMILGRYLMEDPQDLTFNYNALGKPLIKKSGTPNICFNVSHSHEIALYAFTYDRKVGIDIEYIDPERHFMDIAERFFSPKEFSALKSFPEYDQHKAFFEYWTCKEAYLKGRGTGLSFGLDKVEVSITPEHNAELSSINGNTDEAALWSLRQVDAGPGYAAALALEGSARELKCWQWD